ncbi:hypothetical protein D3C84_733700 [compost metagenome]
MHDAGSEIIRVAHLANQVPQFMRPHDLTLTGWNQFVIFRNLTDVDYWLLVQGQVGN